MSWEYIAAFFDGEGYIGMSPSRARKCLATVAAFAQSGTEGLAVLTEIKEFFAANQIKSYLHCQKRSQHKRALRDMYRLSISSRPSLVPFIKNVLLYARVKRAPLEKMLQYFIDNPPKQADHFRKLNAQRKKNGWYNRRKYATYYVCSQKIARDRRVKVLPLAKQGLSQAKIAKILGVPGQLISLDFKALGLRSPFQRDKTLPVTA